MADGLKQSASKDAFVKALNLNMDNSTQKTIFTQMWVRGTPLPVANGREEKHR